jgi:predicted AlkP superfamily pyrophosphatase or phosphodiesterase
MMKRFSTRRARFATLVLCSFVVLFELPALSQRRASPAAGTTKPRLVLAIIVDQFRYDYLERFADLYGEGGFKKLMEGGAVFTDANYEHLPTYTAVGHAAIFSGSVPSQNGIVGNTYYDRSSGRVRIMVADDSAHLVTGRGTGAGGAPSPRTLVGTTIGDQMRLSDNFQSKVVAVSLKDRAAVLPGGQRPNGAFWFSEAGGEFVSSDYYGKELPEWVKKFNASMRPDKYFGAKWDRMLPLDAYKRAQKENTDVQKSALGTGFPYTVTGGEQKPGPRFYGVFEISPFASEYLARFAEAALDAESLGSDQFPDLLSISFSSPDLCGHFYGPDSQEVEDTYLRLDRTIAELLRFIDKRVGLSKTVIVVSGDHGVAPVPEYMQARGIDAGRLSANELITTVNKTLASRYGLEKAVLSFTNEQLYLDQKQIAEKKLDPAEVERVAGDAALTGPGILGYFTRSQILAAQMPDGPIARRVMNGFNRARSGDVWVITLPFYFFSEGSLATTHGSPYNYDTHVPVIFYGAGVQAGRFNGPASPADIAPTLAAILGVEPPSNRVSRVLTEAIAAKAARP